MQEGGEGILATGFHRFAATDKNGMQCEPEGSARVIPVPITKEAFVSRANQD